jgi:prephenate dehydratase
MNNTKSAHGAEEAPALQTVTRIAIQGERGSNSHMAVLAMAESMQMGEVEVVPCTISPEVIEALVSGRVDVAVLPIENTLHGAVAEHYDLMLQHPLRIDAETLLRIRHNMIVAPGVKLNEIKHVLSHPVALAQCRKFLTTLMQQQGTRALPFYDTAGSVKHVMEQGLRDTAGIAPELAAEEYGATVLASAIEDNAANITRFHLLRRAEDVAGAEENPDKVSVAFVVEHRPGTLVAALQALAEAGANLTRIESRPVPGKPWEYVFYAEFRVTGAEMADTAVEGLKAHCSMIKELGRYCAARG